MMEFTIKVTGLENLEAAIKQLAYAVAQCATDHTMPVNTQQSGNMPAQPQTLAQPPQPPAGAMPQQNTQAPQYQAAANPAVPTAPAQPQYQTQPQYQPQQQMPTAPVRQSYTQDQMAIAMTGLIDAGKQSVLMAILQSLGANSLMDIPTEQYPALAARLRQEGANI